MDSSFTIIQILLFLGAAQGFFLSFILLSTRRTNRQANHILAAILIIFCLNIIIHNISHRAYSFSISHHEVIITIIFYLFGPLFYFYVKTLTTGKSFQNKKKYFHFLPFLACLLISIPLYTFSLTLEKPHIILELCAGFVVLHVICYMAWSVKLLRDHIRHIKDSFSSIDQINLRWLRFLIIGFTITWLFALYFDMQIKNPDDWDYVWLLVSLLMYLIGYMGLKQPEIFAGGISAESSDTEQGKRKYKKSALTDDLAEMYLEKLREYMQTQKPYLDSNITLPELARYLSLSVHHLSQVINEKINQNFFEFINQYRVEEAKKNLVDPERKNLTIAAIGFESGFNSNSSFNAVFKKATNKTPSQFRDSDSK
jgi:AraC-like DNA-binding protein